MNFLETPSNCIAALKANPHPISINGPDKYPMLIFVSQMRKFPVVMVAG